MSLFLFLSSTSLGQHYQKSPAAKSRGFGKNIIRSDGPIGGLCIERRFKPFAHYDIERLNGGSWRLDLKGETSDPSSYHGLYKHLTINDDLISKNSLVFRKDTQLNTKLSNKLMKSIAALKNTTLT